MSGAARASAEADQDVSPQNVGDFFRKHAAVVKATREQDRAKAAAQDAVPVAKERQSKPTAKKAKRASRSRR